MASVICQSQVHILYAKAVAAQNNANNEQDDIDSDNDDYVRVLDASDEE